jgi:hypothetical protein
MQRKIYECGISEVLFDLPIPYIMDAGLRDICIPTFCCLIHQSKTNLNVLLRDNSPHQIIKTLRKEMQSKPSLTRKNSTSSLISCAVVSYEYNSLNYEVQRLSLEMRFPEVYWEALCA